MGKYSEFNAENILKNVEACIAELENFKKNGGSYDASRIAGYHEAFIMRAVYKELSIFDWWKSYLSLSQLKQMRTFLKNAIKLGFDGYVCFKVGASGCSHGMWAHKNESVNGYSPDGDVLFHSFRCGDNYYAVCNNGEWHHGEYTLAEIKEILAS